MEMTPRLKGLLWLLVLVIALAIGMSFYVGVHQAQAPMRQASLPLAHQSDTTSKSTIPSIVIVNISGLTLTVQYANLLYMPDGQGSPTSMWVQNEGWSKPLLEVPLGSSSSGTISFSLPANAMEGKYTVTPVGMPSNPYIGGVGNGEEGFVTNVGGTIGASTSFNFSAGSISTSSNQ